MTDEMFVKLMRECGTDEETIAELLAQEKQSKNVIKHHSIKEARPKMTLIPRPVDGIDVYERIDRVWKWLQQLDRKKVSQEQLIELVEMIGAKSGKSLGEVRAQIREEFRKEMEELRGEIASLRAEVPKSRRRKPSTANPNRSNEEDANSQVN